MGKRFQSTPPRRRRRKPVRCRKPMHCHFNPRLREGGDNGQIVFTRQGKDFNPRLREGGDLASYANTLVISGFQSTPPRRRRHFIPLNGESTPLISIHASAKEATMVGCIYRHFKGISIHASAKEATKSTSATTAAKKISIHASAKEATSYHGNNRR